MREPVYERLKAALLTRVLTPGETLHIGVWAEQLRVSSTPVREALTRLAAEGFIHFTPRKGFFARTPSELEIRGLYAANAALLCAAIDHTAQSGNRVDPDSSTPVADSPAGGLSLVLATDELFLRIGRDSGLNELAERIQNLSERLRHVRLVECDVIADAKEELRSMRAHIERARYQELRTAVLAYHETRTRCVAQICRELLIRAFSG